MEETTIDYIERALQFINSTHVPIFITGKAGTGKTTFLKGLSASTYKKLAIVAPTGVAALNAGGSTIHSMFQLPLGIFIPDESPSESFSREANLFTKQSLNKKHFISALKKKVLRELDLLIIDEVSMLRSDLLDAINHRLQQERGNFRDPFGGVQVVFIGDLLQLPPVVREGDWNYIRRYYRNAFFFESKVIQTTGLVYIEFDKVFRQSDERFITVLNHFRENKVTQADLDLLNGFYREKISEEENSIITVTTHNYKADEINRNRLNKLPGKLFTYHSEVEGEFPDSMFPIPSQLELKVGARVMFVKNDPGGMYYNGKMATVCKLEKDEVHVQWDDGGQEFEVKRIVWENKKYAVDDSTKEISEETAGTFNLFPLRLAWAITVHKSQGLTFEKAVIDVGSAFAPGQVYVALSRLKGLDGLILLSKIDSTGMLVDQSVVEFSEKKESPQELELRLEKEQHHFINQSLRIAFDFSQIVKTLEKLATDYVLVRQENEFSFKHWVGVLKNEASNTEKFKHQLLNILRERNHEHLLERLQKGGDYYDAFIWKLNEAILKEHFYATTKKGQKEYANDVGDLEQLVSKKLEQMSVSVQVLSQVIKGKIPHKSAVSNALLVQRRMSFVEGLTEQVPLNKPTTKAKKTKGTKRPSVLKDKLKTHEVTAEAYKRLASLEAVARERAITVGTVESHVFKLIESEDMGIEEFIQEDRLQEAMKLLERHEGQPYSEWFNPEKEGLSYFEMRLARLKMAQLAQ